MTGCKDSAEYLICDNTAKQTEIPEPVSTDIIRNNTDGIIWTIDASTGVKKGMRSLCEGI